MTNSKGYEIGILPECNKLALEQLLNKLIKKGWKPFKVPCKYFEKCNGLEGIPFYHFISNNVLFPGGTRKYSRPSLRQIVSKESGLWQFVCENRMTKKMEKIPRGIWINSWHKSAYEKCPVYTMEKAEYRIIESALCNEEDLEKFLLDNIKSGK